MPQQHAGASADAKHLLTLYKESSSDKNRPPIINLIELEQLYQFLSTHGSLSTCKTSSFRMSALQRYIPTRFSGAGTESFPGLVRGVRGVRGQTTQGNVVVKVKL
jgi:hypothetical protein